MDRFEFGIPDQQEAKVILQCSVSGYDIVEDECYIETAKGDVLKEDLEVLIEYVGGVRKYANDEVFD